MSVFAQAPRQSPGCLPFLQSSYSAQISVAINAGALRVLAAPRIDRTPVHPGVLFVVWDLHSLRDLFECRLLAALPKCASSSQRPATASWHDSRTARHHRGWWLHGIPPGEATGANGTPSSAAGPPGTAVRRAGSEHDLLQGESSTIDV